MPKAAKVSKRPAEKPARAKRASGTASSTGRPATVRRPKSTASRPKPTPHTEATPRFFARPELWRAWLAKNHAKSVELWVGYWRVDSGKPSITWPQSVDQALCFGWIDGLRKSLDGESYMIRFTPRKPDSIWSNVNIKRYRELDAEGLVVAMGRAAWERRTEKRSGVYAFERERQALDAARKKALHANARASRFFAAQTPGYKRLVSDWVMSAKRDETRDSRLQKLVDCCARGVSISPWLKVKPAKD